MGSGDAWPAAFRCFLASAGFLKEEQADREGRGRWANCLVSACVFVSLSNGGSFRRRGPTANDYCGAAAIPKRRRLRRLHRSAASTARFVRDLSSGVTALRRPGQSGTAAPRTTWDFTGQCCRPLCLGDAANHPDGPRTVTERRSAAGTNRLP